MRYNIMASIKINFFSETNNLITHSTLFENSLNFEKFVKIL